MATRKKKTSTQLTTETVAAANAMSFRKTNEAIGLRVVEGSLSLLTRKAFNVMCYHAQNMKEPGKNAPINTPAAKKYYWIQLSDLARDAAYGSKDDLYLREQLQSMQNIKLVMETERQWTSERLISSVTVVKTGNGSATWLGYAFPPEVEQQVMSPSTYTRLSIVFQSSLKSGASLALYEICRRYATNPSHKTAIQSIDYWYYALTGNSIGSDRIPEFKYFKRDMLNPAIEEINQLTDIEISLILHKNGRRIESLQFEVHEKQQAALEFPAPPIIDTELIETLLQFGLSKAAAEDLCATVHDDVIRLAIQKTRARIDNPRLSPIEEPAAYLRFLIAEISRNPAAATESIENIEQQKLTATKSAQAAAEAEAEQQLLQRYYSERAQAALQHYEQLPETDRLALWEDFKVQPANRSVKLDRGLASTMIKNLFAAWYANKLWHEPTPEDIARFAEASSSRRPKQK